MPLGGGRGSVGDSSLFFSCYHSLPFLTFFYRDFCAIPPYSPLTELSKLSITSLEIRRDQIRNIRRGVLARDSEEIIGGGAAAAVTGGIVLQEAEEGIVTHAVVQGFEEVRPVEIAGVDIGAERRRFING